ncbi:MAG: 60S ribosomal export protein NMD3 [Methanobacterium sp.]
MNDKIFCPQCGKTGVKLFSGLCRSCFIEKTCLINIPKEIDIIICTHCGSIQKKGRWMDSELSLDDTVIETVYEHVEIDDSASDVEISVKILTIRGSIFECLVNVKAYVMDEILTQEFLVEVKVNKSVCIACSKYASGYYEAVIQMRADSRLLSDDEIGTADKIVRDKMGRLSNKNRMAYISQRVEMKEGIDYYVGSYKAARKLTEALRNVFGGVLKDSPRLMGRDKTAGKDLYRIWFSLRLPQFQKYDFVKYNNMKTQVLNFDANKIYLKDLESSATISVAWRDYEKLKLIARKNDIKLAMITAKTPQLIQILHPDTYQPVDIQLNDELRQLHIGEELKVVEIDNILYVI